MHGLLSHSALLPYYRLRDSSIKSTVIFEISRMWTEFKCSDDNTGNDWRRWDKIANGLYLGKIPSMGNSIFSVENQHEQIISFVEKTGDGEHPLGLVISAVDYRELAATAIVPPHEWEKNKVKQLIVPISDFTADVPNEVVIRTVHAIRKEIEAGKSVYVHCKAGRSRSTMLCVVYLALFGNGDDLQAGAAVDEIERYLVGLRPQVELNPSQKRKAAEVIQEMMELQLLEKHLVTIEDNKLGDTQEEVHVEEKDISRLFGEYLSSVEIKNAIIHLPAFKKLALHACQIQGYIFSGSQTEAIKSFFMEIYHSTNETWYLNLIRHEGSLKTFVESTTFSATLFANDKGVREKFRDDFINELNQHLAKKFGCEVDEIKMKVEEVTGSQTKLASNSAL